MKATHLAQTDGEILRTLKEPGFAQWVLYAYVAASILEKVYGWITRGKPGRTVVSGSLETIEASRPADAKKVEELERQVTSLREEHAAQHRAALQAGEHRVMDLSKVMDEETAEITQRIHDTQDKLMEKMESIFKGISDKVETIALASAKHGVEIPNITQRFNELLERYNEDLPKIHDRINDAMAAAARRRS